MTSLNVSKGIVLSNRAKSSVAQRRFLAVSDWMDPEEKSEREAHNARQRTYDVNPKKNYMRVLKDFDYDGYIIIPAGTILEMVRPRENNPLGTGEEKDLLEYVNVDS